MGNWPDEWGLVINREGLSGSLSSIVPFVEAVTGTYWENPLHADDRASLSIGDSFLYGGTKASVDGKDLSMVISSSVLSLTHSFHHPHQRRIAHEYVYCITNAMFALENH